MLSLSLNNEDGKDLKVLCLGSHSDGLEIGCGGTILKLIEKYRQIEICWVVFSGNELRADEARKGAQVFLKQGKDKRVIIKDFRESFFPYIGFEIKEYFEQLKQEFTPDIVFTHYRHDLHQDHRLISELTWSTFRDHLILEYEIPKYDGDFGSPNLFVPISESICRRKIQYLLDTFETQKNKHWFSEDTFSAMLRLRGMESKSPSKFAEAFYCRKMVI